jgi:hypothetical protein
MSLYKKRPVGLCFFRPGVLSLSDRRNAHNSETVVDSLRKRVKRRDDPRLGGDVENMKSPVSKINLKMRSPIF